MMNCDGRRIATQVDDIAGFPGKPMTRADIDAKFRNNVGKRWPRARTDGILRAFWQLEGAADLPSLLRTLSI